MSYSDRFASGHEQSQQVILVTQYGFKLPVKFVCIGFRLLLKFVRISFRLPVKFVRMSTIAIAAATIRVSFKRLQTDGKFLPAPLMPNRCELSAPSAAPVFYDRELLSAPVNPVLQLFFAQKFFALTTFFHPDQIR